MVLQIIVNFAVFVAAFNPGHYSAIQDTQALRHRRIYSSNSLFPISLHFLYSYLKQFLILIVGTNTYNLITLLKSKYHWHTPTAHLGAVVKI